MRSVAGAAVDDHVGAHRYCARKPLFLVDEAKRVKRFVENVALGLAGATSAAVAILVLAAHLRCDDDKPDSLVPVAPQALDQFRELTAVGAFSRQWGLVANVKPLGEGGAPHDALKNVL